MSSFPTVTAFVHNGSWDDTTREHPALKMMETITNEFDKTNVLNPAWYAADSSFQKTDGSQHHGLEAAMMTTRQNYEPLQTHYHEPHSIVCVETDDGYKMWGQATLFGNLAGVPAEGETKVTDRMGREWDVELPGGWFNYYVRDEHAKNGLGMVIKRSEVAADSAITMRAMLKRGLISASDLVS
ncbi:hypothetical protein MMC15_004511 [Xylographa vitiligo]|nr:hypothetical protein [Xylographa vitiligo]